MIPVAKRVKQAREARGLSVHNLAILSGVDAFSIQRIEQGRLQPSWSILAKLADGLQVHPSALLGPYPGRMLPRYPRYIERAS